MLRIHRRDVMQGISFVLFCLSSVPLWSSGAETELKPLPFTDLQLSLRAGKSEYLLGEPVALYETLTNPRDQPAWAPRSLGPGLLELTRDGNVVRWTADYGAPPGYPGGGPSPEPMAPKSVRRAKQLVICAGKAAPLLSSSGPVQIIAMQGIVFWPKGERQGIASNRVEIVIREPKGEDAEAYRWIREHDLVEYLGDLYFLQERLQASHLQALRGLLGKYPKSVYAPYAAFALGQKQFYDEKYAEAIKTLGRLAEEYSKSAVAEDALRLVAQSYRKQQKSKEADKAFRELIRQYPNTPAADDAKTALGEIVR